MKVFITGGLGYLGSVLTRRLHAEGYSLILFDRMDFGRESVEGLLGEGRLELVQGDLREIEQHKRCFSGVHAVIHLAGLTDDPTAAFDPEATRQVNIEATRLLAEVAKAAGVRRFVFASSCSVYGGSHDLIVTEETPPHPLSLYAQTKWQCEQILEVMNDASFCTTSLRLGTLFGWSPRMRFDSVVNLMTFYAVRKGEISVTGGGKQWRPFVHVQDVSRAVQLILDAPIEKVGGQIFNLGGEENNVQIEALAHKIQQVMPKISVKIIPEDADPRSYRVQETKLRRTLGYRPQHSIEEGVREVAGHLQTGEVPDLSSPRYSNMRTLLKRVAEPVVAGGLPVRTAFLPLVKPHIGEEEKQAVVQTMESGWLTTGPKTLAFEKAFARAVEAPHAVAVNSCTAALHLALTALDIGPGDEVITTPLTFAATANVVLHRGARPVFADVDPLTLNILPEQIAAKATSKTRAVIPVHMAGRPCSMGEIHQLAKAKGWAVIEDAAHAIGSSCEGRPIGSLSDFTAFSFYPSKNMTSAEGGMITLHDEAMADKLRLLRLHGMSKDAWKRHGADAPLHFQIELPGYKANMTDIQAVIGLEQLKKLERFKKWRGEIVRLYNEAFRDEPALILPPPPSHGDSICWYVYIVQLRLQALTCTRDEFAQALKKENIGFGFHFISLHLQPYYRDTFGFKPDDFPGANQASQRILSLPLFTEMNNKDVEDVIFVMKKLLRHFRR